MKEQSYLCTRPVVAAYLVYKGYKCQMLPNPWNAQKQAWLFSGNDALSDAKRYHIEHGLKLPKALANIDLEPEVQANA